VARIGEKTVSEQTLKTANEPTGIRLSVYEDESSTEKSDIAHITAELIDAHNLPVRHKEQSIHFKIEGAAENIGVDNGCSFSLEKHKSDHYTTKHGKCLLVLQGKPNLQPTTIIASGEGLKSNSISISNIN
jgi:beta-galactosidase